MNALQTPYLIKRFEKAADGDGQPVEVYETSMPAKFYTVKALPSKNSVGAPIPGFTLGTGSGSAMRELAMRIAQATSEGMLGIEP